MFWLASIHRWVRKFLDSRLILTQTVTLLRLVSLQGVFTLHSIAEETAMDPRKWGPATSLEYCNRGEYLAFLTFSDLSVVLLHSGAFLALSKLI